MGSQLALKAGSHPQKSPVNLTGLFVGREAPGASTAPDQTLKLDPQPQLVAVFWLQDQIRPDSAAAVQLLQAQGYQLALLSGDNARTVAQVADALGIADYHSAMTPAAKLEYLQQAQQRGRKVAMVGDGINDAPALAKATIGISLSNASHIAIQSAQVVLMNNGLKNLPMSLVLGRKTYETIKENLAWAFSYNIIAIPVAAFGFLGTWGPTYGAMIMALSDVVLALNSLRLFKKNLTK